MKRITRPLIAALAVVCGSCAMAQEYPNRAVRLVIPFAPGGTTDTLGRVFAQAFQGKLGQPVIVDNRPGAGSQIGTDSVAKAAPDGYTMLLGPADVLAILPALKRKLPYDPLKDFSPVSLIAHSPMVFAVNAKFAPRTLGELIDYAKAKPGEVRFGSAGIGSILQLTVELLRAKTGTDMVHVPYKGGGPATVDLVGGQIQLLAAGAVSVAKQADAGHVRLLAQTGPTRHALIPNVPTTAELGMADVAVVSWFGLVGPPGLAPAIINRLAHDVAAVNELHAFRQRMIDIGCESTTLGPQEFAKYIADENRKWVQVVAAAKIPPQD